MAYVLAAAALLLTWLVFRLERYARQEGAVEAARATLDAVQHGMVTGTGSMQGWGDTYFATRYTQAVVRARAQQDHDAVQHGHVIAVLEVPTEPLARLASATDSPALLLPRMRAAANTALWRVRAFNQLVRTQSTFVAQHAAEIRNPATPQVRKDELAHAAALLSALVHADGIGEAGAPDGWYGALKAALDENLRHLDRLTGFSCRGYLREPQYVVLDALVIGGFAAALAVYAA